MLAAVSNDGRPLYFHDVLEKDCIPNKTNELKINRCGTKDAYASSKIERYNIISAKPMTATINNVNIQLTLVLCFKDWRSDHASSRSPKTAGNMPQVIIAASNVITLLIEDCSDSR